MRVMKLFAIATGLTALCVAAPINVAFSGNGGVASQSSTYSGGGGPASNANDGNTNGNWDFGNPANNSISHTESELNAWWQVSFNATYIIGSIEVFNRTDNPSITNARLNPFSVFLYDAANSVVWSSLGNQMTLPATTATFAVPSVAANRLRVQLDGTNYLHLAEVQANVVPEPSTYALMAGGLALLGMLRRRKS